MEATEITSSSNERLKRWKRIVSSPRHLRRERATLAEGFHLAMATRDARCPVSAIRLRADCPEEASRLAREVFDETASQGRAPRLFVIDPPLYEGIAPVEAGSGIMLEVALPGEPDRASLRGRDALYLDGVQDAGNAGTLIRTAVASGVRVIAASRKTACLWSPKVIRAAMGAHFGATVLEGVEPGELKALFGARNLAADARGGRDIWAEKGWEKGPTVWMMGAEGPGLSDAALDAADLRLYIPIEPETESLNVGAAAAVCLFEQRRRRLAR